MTTRIFHIIGKVLDRQTRRGAAGLRVEAWDKDRVHDDLVGRAVTDAQGRFSITFSESSFRELFGDRRPDLYFKVFRGTELMTSTEDSILWNVEAATIPVTIEVDLPPVAPPAPVDEVDLIGHRISGRLLDQKTGRPLPRLVVHAFDLDAGPEPKDLGVDLADAKGRFTVTYTTKRTPKGTLGAATGRRLRFHILDRQRKEIFQAEIPTHADPRQVVEVRVPVPEVREAPSPSLEEIARKSKVKIPSALIDALGERGIRSLTDVRRQGGLEHVKDLPLPADDPALRLLDAHANLSLISSDLELNETLIVEKGFRSIGAVARTPREDFVAAAHEKAGHFKAAQMHVKAKAQTGYLSNVLMGLKADWANGFPVRLKDITNPHIPQWFRRTCECKDCESAVSPQAYLADLLDYAVMHLWNNGRAIDIAFLVDAFHQPFAELSTSCEAASEQIRQVRLCIEVLREHGRRLEPAKQASYCLAAYADLLTRLGTSYQELRLLRRGEDQKRASVADRLGIGVAHLDDLRLEQERITERELETVFGLRDTNRRPTQDTPTASVEAWRLDFLRSVWRQQDWPRDPYTEAAEANDNAGLLPVIDPDLIGPDDFRHPEPKRNENDPDQPFDIWLRRRRWVDARWAEFAATVNGQGVRDLPTLLDRMDDPLTDYADITAWTRVPAPQELERYLQSTSAGSKQEAEAAATAIQRDLHLTVDSFTRLMAIRAKDQDRRDAISSEAVSDDEWRELFSILVQAQKVAVFPTWRREERAWRDARHVRTLLGPRDLWHSLREPVEGEWPPLKPVANRPWIDPDHVKPEDLPEPTAGARATEIWQDRREQVEARIAELRLARRQPGSGFDQIVQGALHQTPEALSSIENDLESQDPARVQTATHEIETTLHLTVEEFRRLRDLAAKGERLTADDWEDLYRMLARAVKERDWIPGWFDDERNERLNGAELEPGEYWRALKARLPRWRASVEARQQWQQALRVRRQAPVIDPDLIDAGRLLDPFNGPAAVRWRGRQAWADLRGGRDEQRGEIEAARLAQGLDRTLEEILGVGPDTLTHIERDAEEGEDIIPRVEQLNLTLGAFRHLLRIRQLAQIGPDAVLPSEWQETYAILFQVEKRRRFAEWRQEEQDDDIILALDPFKLPEPLAVQFPPPEPPPLPAWRAARRDLQDWDQRLQSRIDQQQAVVDGLRSLVSNTEAACLPSLRDDLVDTERLEGGPAANTRAAKAKWLTDHLLIDAQAGGCQMTTRVAQAIETLQGLLWSIRTGQLTDTYPRLELRAADFDEEWRWIGSYATWRAAMFVFIYPENILLPSLRHHQTPAFRRLVNELRTAGGRLMPGQACELAASYYDYFEDVCHLRLKASRQALTRIHRGAGCHRQAGEATQLRYFFGQPLQKRTVYWSAYNMKDWSGYALSFWDTVPGLDDVTLVIGAQPYEISPGKRFLYLFARTEHAGQLKLVFSRYDLENQAWEGEPTELELPEGTATFQATIILRNRESEPPRLRLHCGGRVYERSLNAEGTTWGDDDWRPMDRAWGSWSLLPAPEGFSIPPNAAATAVARGDQAIHVFLVGDDGRVQGTSSTDAVRWDSWTPVRDERFLPGGAVAAASAPNGDSLHLFGIRDGDNHLYWSTLAGDAWTAWTDVGVDVRVSHSPFPDTIGHIDLTGVVPPAVVKRQVGDGYELRLFVAAGWGVYTTLFRSDGEWNRYEETVIWERLGLNRNVPPGSEVSAIKVSPWHVFLFVVGDAGGVLTNLWNANHGSGEWGGQPIGGTADVFPIPSSVTAVVRARQLELYIVDQDGAVRTTSWSNRDSIDSWAAWSSISDPEQVTFRKGAAISAVKTAGDHVNLFALSEDGVVYGTWSDPEHDSGDWHPWLPIGLARQAAAVQQARIAAVSYHDQIHLFIVGSQGRIYHNASQDWQAADPITVALPEGYEDRPRVAEPLRITAPNSTENLQQLRDLIGEVFGRNPIPPEVTPRPLWNLAYLEEAYYFVPLQIALRLQAAGQYVAALDWFRTVYDYSAEPNPEADGDPHKIAYVLRREDLEEEPELDRANDWLLDPLNPHTLAITRPGTYTRFTLMSLVRCLLEYGDAEFTRDTAESVPRARVLYSTALELLDLPEVKRRPGCEQPRERFPADLVPDPRWQTPWEEVLRDLDRINEAFPRFEALREVMQVMRGGDPALGEGPLPPLEERLAGARRRVDRALGNRPSPPALGVVVADKAGSLDTAYEALLGYDNVAGNAERVGAIAGRDFLNGLALVVGVEPRFLVRERFEFPWLGHRLSGNAEGVGPAPGVSGFEAPVWGEYEERTRYDELAPSRLAELALLARREPEVMLDFLFRAGRGYHPEPWSGFCIPRNPVLEALRLHAEMNLYKIRTCRNIAGTERQLEPYAAATDVVSGLPTIGSDGRVMLPGTVALLPTAYRYAVLIERAKQLVQLAAQIEAGMLAALEKRDAEAYTALKARQDISLARAGVTLQDLRVREAEGGVTLAELQKERALFQVETYERWLDEDTNSWEDAAIVLMYATVGLHAAAAAAAAAGIPSSKGWSTGAEALSSLAAGTSTLASIFSTYADNERRRQGWEFEKGLAMQDASIAAQQIRINEDHVRVAGQERVIAKIQAEHASDTLEFLTNKFTNVELYDWMSTVLEGVYRFFLQRATAMAKLAENQLAFERQTAPVSFIQADYWEGPSDSSLAPGAEGHGPDRRGLTGSAPLLQDVHQLDQHAFETDKRKLQLSKTLSLARMAPFEFQRFRETGVITLRTPMELFDRDFPGHYLRLIHKVRTSVIALIPPTEGIRASLSASGLSRVVIGPEVFQTVAVRRPPESVALTSPTNATGLFELEAQSEMLLPFEGMGVDITWEFRMAKGANLFDYRTIADVLITLEYTALQSFDYQQQVIQTLSPNLSADRPFSFRHQFADPWYDLHNPDQTATPMTVSFKTVREDFPPNLENLRIVHVVLYFARAAGQPAELPTASLRFIEEGGAGFVGGEAAPLEGVISTRRGNAGGWMAMLGKAPMGTWELALPNTQEARALFKHKAIEDLLLVITYSGRTPAWPS